MNTSTRIQISGAFIWIGFIASISFMEAWLKFTAPGISLLQGLAIGQIVFGALNKVELSIATIIVMSYLPDKFRLLYTNWFLLLALAALAAQSVHVLPALSQRIDMHLNGEPVPPSSLHTVYIGLEVIKVVTLLFYGYKQMTNERN